MRSDLLPPVPRFDEMRWVPRAAEERHPRAVGSLAPGESGFAGVLLSAADGSGGDGDGGATDEKLAVAFGGHDPGQRRRRLRDPGPARQGVYHDSSLTVTYRQQDREDALSR
ncbi:hypothetical protein ACFW2X_21575 [Streptomyces antibioticus]|uniref:hypothetical protein n=1 Tax=Streptomyces antibioticus TaxID=1890 RepID=UPI0036A45259